MAGNVKTAGTYFMDGMLQGRVPDSHHFEERVNRWLALHREGGLKFDFAIEGGRFSVLADDTLGQAKDFLPDGIQKHLARCLQELLELVPPQDHMQIMSTLRSVEYRPGTEVQTLYGIVPPGRIEVTERSVKTDTASPPRELTLAGKFKLGSIGLAAALVIVLGSSLFVDWKSWFSQRADALRPVKVEAITLDAKALSEFIALEKKAIDKRRGGLVLAAKRGPGWDAAITSTQPVASSWDQFFAVASIKKGYLRCEMFDAEGSFFASAIIRLQPLLDSANGEAELLVPLPGKKVHRIVIGPF